MNLKTKYGTEKNIILRGSRYMYDNSLAVGVFTEDEELYCVLTTCLDDKTLGNDEAYVDTNNCPFAVEFLKEYNLAAPTGRTRQSGFCEYPLYKFDLSKLELN